MTRCPEFYDKYEKDGNFCGLSPSAITQIKAYNEMREQIGKHIPDRALVVENFPEFAARSISTYAKDDATKTKALDYVVHCLKRNEKVTHNDLKKTIQGWLKPDSCSVEENDDTVGHVSEKFTYVKSSDEKEAPKDGGQTLADTIRKQEIQEASTNQPADPPRPKPAPCKDYKKSGDTYEICPDFRHHIDSSNKLKGPCCNVLNTPLNQLPHDECPIQRRNRLKGTQPDGFHPASEDGLGNKFVKPAPYVITAVKITKEEANQRIRDTKGYLTDKDWLAFEEILKTGELGDSYIEVFTGLIWWGSERMGV